MFAIELTAQNNNIDMPTTSNTELNNYLPKTTVKLEGISTKDITDRQTTKVVASDNLNFKEYNAFDNIAEMLDYFLVKVTKIHQEHGIPVVDDKIEKFITYTKKLKVKVHNSIFYDDKDLYDFLRKTTLFIAIFFKTAYKNIISIVDYFFYRCSSTSPIKKMIVNFLRDVDIQEIREIATNKNLYLFIADKHFKYKLSHYNIQKFTIKRHQDNSNRITIINQVVDSCNDKLKKKIISKYVTDILQICAVKRLSINNKLIAIIKALITSNQITYTDIAIILKKIAVYLQAIADQNPYADISMLTKFLCRANGIISTQALFELRSITDAQLQDITSQKYSTSMAKKRVFNGFSMRSLINAEIKQFNHSTDKTTENVAVTSQQAVQAISKTTQVQPAVIAPNSYIINADAIFKVVVNTSEVAYVDINDCKIISEFHDAERKLLTSAKVHDTNETNNSEVKKRKADEQSYNQAKKYMRLEIPLLPKDRLINRAKNKTEFKAQFNSRS